ncbi:MAG: phage tail protein [Caldilineaceae bacterium]
MDANGLRFWMLANQEEWESVANTAPVAYHQESRSLRLASRRRSPLPVPEDLVANRAAAEAALNRIPQTRDGFETRALWDDGAKQIVATGAVNGTTPIYTPPADAVPTDLVTGFDGILYLALNGAVVMIDLRRRWQPVTVALIGFAAWRLAADPAGGVWALDRENRKLARMIGEPLPDQAYEMLSPNVFRPSEENPNPPRLVERSLSLETNETPVAIACHPQSGEVTLLCWVTDSDALLLRQLQSHALQRVTLLHVRHPYTLAWVSAERIAVLVPELASEALIYDLNETPADDVATSSEAVGDFYPLRNHSDEPFVHGLDLPTHYVSGTDTRPLFPLSLASYSDQGEAWSYRPFDSNNVQTVWHRLYLEAVIPPHCSIKVLLAATNSLLPPDPTSDDWFEHRFGTRLNETEQSRLPRGVWLSQPSEIPFHEGFLPCVPVPNRSGLFTVLIQCAGHRVSALSGRYLHVRVVLLGDGRSTPEIYALRAYSSRFSYVEHYLPALYHEDLFPSKEENLIGPGRPPSPADFLERFVNNFEGILTPLEDRIAAAWLLTDPRSTSDEALDWLGSWIGMSFAPAHPQARRRDLLAAAPQLFRRRGTLAGLAQALEIVTGGAVSGGEIVIVENWRLRRTFVTILGADFAEENDPLLPGLIVSGNSFVGDTLFVAGVRDEQRKEFLALFAADLPKSTAETQAVQQFLDQLAYRVTVLVHQEVDPQDMGMIRQIVELEKPAHIEVQVLPASEAFRVGMAALVGVDSYLSPEPPPRPVRVETSSLGVRDLILHPPSLDPRLEG